MEPESNQITNEVALVEAKPSILPWIVTILIAAWIIGMGILGAGWLIAQKLQPKSETVPASVAPEKTEDTSIAIEIPEQVHSLGSNEAKVTVIEFADYQCPFCGEWQKIILPQLKKEYIETGKVKFIYWDFPFLGEESFWAAEAAQCAADQNKFWEYHDALFGAQQGENEGAFSEVKLKNIAKSLNLDAPLFNACLSGKVHEQLVKTRTNQAKDAGVSSTPTLSINGYKLSGLRPWSQYQQLIEMALNK